MGPRWSYMRLATTSEHSDPQSAKMHGLTPDLVNICRTWAKKHIWCGGIIATLFLVSLVYLVGQKPEVCPQPDGPRPRRCTELEREVSGLQVKLSKDMETREKEKAKAQAALDRTQQLLGKLEEEKRALRARLADFNQTLAGTQKLLKEATEGSQRIQVEMEEANQSLVECRQRENSCQDQLHTLQKTIASQEEELNRHQAEKQELHVEIERHRQQINMQKSEEMLSNQRLREWYEQRIRNLEDQLGRQQQQRALCDCETVSPTFVVLGGLLLLAILCKCCGSVCN